MSADEVKSGFAIRLPFNPLNGMEPLAHFLGDRFPNVEWNVLRDKDNIIYWMESESDGITLTIHEDRCYLLISKYKDELLDINYPCHTAYDNNFGKYDLIISTDEIEKISKLLRYKLNTKTKCEIRFFFMQWYNGRGDPSYKWKW